VADPLQVRLDCWARCAAV